MPIWLIKMTEEYKTIHIYRNGQPILHYDSSPGFYPSILMYKDKKDVDWFESLPQETSISFHRLIMIPVGEDDLENVENVYGDIRKSRLSEEIIEYKAVPNMIFFHSSIEGMFDAIDKI